MVSFLVRNIKRIRRLYFALGKVAIGRLIREQFSSAASAYVLFPDYFKSFVTNEWESIFILTGVAQEHFPSVKLISGRKASLLRNVTVIYSPSPLFNYSGKINYTSALMDIVTRLEQNNCQVIYSARELLFWENKAYMYGKFQELNLSHPATWMFPITEPEKAASLQYPLLVKEEHSFASRGLHKVDSHEQLLELVASESFRSANEIIILQSLVKMHKDLRVIVIGGEVVLHYWRINPAKEWRPTSTSYGSDVDFVTFPVQWRNWIVDVTKKLVLTTGAFDLTWENDDTNGLPIILEVSPSYQPNPPITTIPGSMTYGQYKKAFMWRNSWDKKLIDIIFDFKSRHIGYIMKNNGRNQKAGS